MQSVYSTIPADWTPYLKFMYPFEEKSRDRNPSNVEEPETIAKEEWSKIAVSVYSGLIRNYQSWSKTIIENKGYMIDYWSKRVNKFITMFKVYLIFVVLFANEVKWNFGALLRILSNPIFRHLWKNVQEIFLKNCY